MARTADAYRKLLHRFFDGDKAITARVLRSAGLPPFTRQRSNRGTQEQIDFGEIYGEENDAHNSRDEG